MNFVDELATARHELAEARKHASFDADFFRARCTPEQFAELSSKVAEYEVKAEALHAILEGLEARACHRCQGLGVFAGASRRFLDGRGQPKCFACKGRGYRAG